MELAEFVVTGGNSVTSLKNFNCPVHGEKRGEDGVLHCTEFRCVFAFGAFFFGFKPHAGQVSILQEQTAPLRVVACGRQFGKSYLASIDLLFFAFKKPSSRQFVFAPTADMAATIFSNVEALALGSSAFRPIVGNCVKKPFQKIALGNGSIIEAYSLDSEGKFVRGKNADRIWIDEASRVKDGVVEEVVLPMLWARSGQLNLISTPFGHNWFYRYFCDVDKLGGKSFRFTSFDNPFLNKVLLEQSMLAMSDLQRRCEIYAEFVEDANLLFKHEAIEAAIDRSLSFYHSPGKLYSMGVDVAKVRDYTVITVLESLPDGKAQVAYMERFNETNAPKDEDYWDYAIQRICTMARQYQPSWIVIDQSSAGSPVLEQVQREFPQAEGYTFTNSLQNPKKVYLLQNLVVGFEQKRIKMPLVEFLFDELRFFEVKRTESQNLQMQAAHGKHDDAVISLALAFSKLAVTPGEPTIVEIKRSEEPKSSERNPFVFLGDFSKDSRSENPFVTEQVERYPLSETGY